MALKTTDVNTKYLVIITILFCFLLAAGAYFFYKNEESRIRVEKQANIEAIAHLKINEIVQWKEERLSEASFFAGESQFRDRIKKLLNNTNDASLKEYFVKTLSPIRQNHYYNNIFISGIKGKIIFSLDTSFSRLEPEILQDIQRSADTKKIVIKDFYKCEIHNGIHLDIISPVIDETHTTIALLILRINPKDYLYPLIQTWPVPSRTSETLILRKDGDNILFLNELRHKKNSALNYEIPLALQERVAVKAVLGYVGTIEALDYMGVKVLASVHPVPGTPWIMVSKTNQDEVYAETRNTARLVIVIIIVIILFLITFLTLFYKQKQNKLFKEIILRDSDLAEAKEEFRTTLYSIGDAVITTDVNGRIKQMNNVAEHLTGWKEKEANSRYISEVFNIINEDTNTKVASPVQRVLSEGIVVGLANHTILISKSGKEIPISDSGSPIKNQSGEIVGVVLVFRDQTEEREAEKNLRESEERYRSIFQNTNSIMFIIDPDTAEIKDANPAACNFYGYNQEEFIQKNISDINLFTQDKIFEDMQDAKQKARNQFILRHKLANGEVKDVEVYSGPIKLNGKKVLFSIVHDITERKLAEEALRVSEEKFSKAFKTSPDSINFNRLSDGLYIEINQGFSEMTGYSANDVLGKASIDINIWADPNDRTLLIKGLKENGEVINLEALFRKKNGDLFTGLMSARTIIVNGEECIISVTRDITERKKAEEALKESEQRLKLFVEHAPAAIAMLDNNMHYIIVSKRWLTDYNLNINEDITGLSHYDVFPEISEKWKNIHQECLAGAVEICEEDTFPRADGSSDWLRWEIHPWYKSGSEIGGIIIFSEVITERKKAEEAFKEKARLEEQISKIAVTAPGGLCSLQLYADGRICFPYVSPIWEDLMDLKKEDVANDASAIFKRISPDDLENVQSSILESAKSMTDWYSEFKILHPQKGIIWVEGHATPSRQKDDSTIWHGFITNISARKLAEENIRKLSRGIEQSPAIIMITDINGNIEYTNPKFTEITGYSSDEAIGMNPRILQSGIKPREEYEILWDTILGKKEWRGEFLNKKKNGDTYWELASISPILNGQGDITNFIAVKEDITERKRMTDELIAAKNKAEEMNRIKSYFFANMSHELRTPFVGIIGFSEILSDILQNPEEREMAETILRSSRRLTDTLNKILNITKLEFDKIDIHLSDVDVTGLIKNLYVLYSKNAEEKNTRFNIEFKQDPLLWETDEKLLREILSNLINNAIKFTKNGFIKITAESISKNNSTYLVVKISDTGVGIPIEKQEMVWQEFRQAREGYNRPFEGAGLGLSITKKYVELIGGNIYMKSEEGKGSTFTVEIPQPSEVNQNKETPAITDNNISLATQKKHPDKFLYIEDDIVSLEYVKKILSKNYTFDTAESAEKAIELIKNNYYTALLIDINLGYGMNGIDLLQNIRQIPFYKNIPAIAVTAYASSSDKEEFLSKGFTHYISKPFSAKEFKDLLEKIVSVNE